MAYKKQTKKEIVRFEDDQPVSLVLDTDPMRVKGKTTDGEYGPRTSYMYFTEDDRIFFATEFLHNQLATFSRGDEVTITKARTDGGKVNWIVKRGGSSSRNAINNLRNRAGVGNNLPVEDRLAKLEEAVFGKPKTKKQDDEEDEEEGEEVNTEGLGF